MPWQRDLFEAHCLKSRYALDDGLPPAARAELEGVAAEFGHMPAVLVHRDFQSSNVLYRKDGTPAFIDFQGMRLGPAVYDLASILYDPYSPNMGEEERAALLRAYGGVSSRDLALGAVQRLVQSLGAFGNLLAASRKRISTGFRYYHSVKGVHFLSYADFHAFALLTETLLGVDNDDAIALDYLINA